MSKAEAGGAVSLSIDLELAIGRQTQQGQQRLEAVTAGLVEILDAERLSATWGVSNPALSAAKDVILAANTRQEIAVLGERYWLGNGTTPSRLAQEFKRRFEGARRAGMAVSTLVLRQDEQHLDLNLLLEHGITAVRGPAVAASHQENSRAAAMRYGIWQVRTPLRVPLSGSWWQAEPWAYQRRLKEAAKSGMPLHLVLDAGNMVEYSDLALPAVGVVLRQLAHLQASQKLSFRTLGEQAQHDLSRRASQPSRSVLAA